LSEFPKNWIVLAVSIGVVLIGWGVLLSPPMDFVRESLGIQEQPYSRAVILDGEKAAEICDSDPEGCKEYLSRIVFLYHSVFAIIIALVIYLATSLFKFSSEYRKPVIALTTVGYLMTVSGGILYGYWIRDLFLHGLFITGLAALFFAGILFILGFKVKEDGRLDLLNLNILLAVVFLLITSVLGAWVGANQTEIGESLSLAIQDSRINPDLVQNNIPWRVMTAHQHGMVAILGAAVSFLVFKHYRINTRGRAVKISLILALVGQTVMSIAVWAVWPFGRPAHLAITPSSVLLLAVVSSIVISDLVTRIRNTGIKNLLTDGLSRISSYLLIIGIWPTVAIPGAIVAISLRNPVIIKPEFRNVIWDWAENAFSIGHWHILIFFFGAALFIIILDLFRTGRIGKLISALAGISAVLAAIAINFYMVPFEPENFIPNPYNNLILTYFVEPALGIFSVSIAAGFFYILNRFIKEKKIK
jgi:hypothetical protein